MCNRLRGVLNTYGYPFSAEHTAVLTSMGDLFVAQLQVELVCFYNDWPTENGGLGRYGHCRRVIETLWGENNKLAYFQFTPWAEEMLETLCAHPGSYKPHYVAITGCASSGKSDTMAVFGLVCFLSNPRDTAVLITSTTLEAAKKRVWSYVCKYWNALPDFFKPGKLVGSYHMIRFEDPAGVYPPDDKMGLHLLACERKNEKTAIARLIGFKATQMIVLGDEFCELSPAVLEAARSNLSVNEKFTLTGVSNFKSCFDPLGIMSEPVDGWGSIHADMTRWKTKMGGICLHFDAEKSPNILAKKVIYRFLPTQDWVDEQAGPNGERKNTIAYWRMVKGFPAPEGAVDGLYTEQDLLTYGASETCEFIDVPIPVAAIDMSGSNTGDGSVGVFGLFGTIKDDAGKPMSAIQFTEWKRYFDDRFAKKRRTQQIAEQFRKDCEARNVKPEHAGYDSTSLGGTMFGDVLAEQWSAACYPCCFGGAPSTMRVGVKNAQPAVDKFVNKISELWGCGVDFVRSGQLKGIRGEFAEQLTWRKIKGHKKKGDNLAMEVEPKEDMRTRMQGKSPDIADAGLIILDLCRFRFKFRANVAKVVNEHERAKWKAFTAVQDKVAQTIPQIVTNAFQQPIIRRTWAEKLKPIEGEGWGTRTLLR